MKQLIQSNKITKSKTEKNKSVLDFTSKLFKPQNSNPRIARSVSSINLELDYYDELLSSKMFSDKSEYEHIKHEKQQLEKELKIMKKQLLKQNPNHHKTSYTRSLKDSLLHGFNSEYHYYNKPYTLSDVEVSTLNDNYHQKYKKTEALSEQEDQLTLPLDAYNTTNITDELEDQTQTKSSEVEKNLDIKSNNEAVLDDPQNNAKIMNSRTEMGTHKMNHRNNNNRHLNTYEDYDSNPRFNEYDEHLDQYDSNAIHNPLVPANSNYYRRPNNQNNLAQMFDIELVLKKIDSIDRTSTNNSHRINMLSKDMEAFSQLLNNMNELAKENRAVIRKLDVSIDSMRYNSANQNQSQNNHSCCHHNQVNPYGLMANSIMPTNYMGQQPVPVYIVPNYNTSPYQYMMNHHLLNQNMMLNNMNGFNPYLMNQNPYMQNMNNFNPMYNNMHPNYQPMYNQQMFNPQQNMVYNQQQNMPMMNNQMYQQNNGNFNQQSMSMNNYPMNGNFNQPQPSNQQYMPNQVYNVPASIENEVPKQQTKPLKQQTRPLEQKTETRKLKVSDPKKAKAQELTKTKNVLFDEIVAKVNNIQSKTKKLETSSADESIAPIQETKEIIVKPKKTKALKTKRINVTPTKALNTAKADNFLKATSANFGRQPTPTRVMPSPTRAMPTPTRAMPTPTRAMPTPTTAFQPVENKQVPLRSTPTTVIQSSPTSSITPPPAPSYNGADVKTEVIASPTRSLDDMWQDQNLNKQIQNEAQQNIDKLKELTKQTDIDQVEASTASEVVDVDANEQKLSRRELRRKAKDEKIAAKRQKRQEKLLAGTIDEPAEDSHHSISKKQAKRLAKEETRLLKVKSKLGVANNVELSTNSDRKEVETNSGKNFFDYQSIPKKFKPF